MLAVTGSLNLPRQFIEAKQVGHLGLVGVGGNVDQFEGARVTGERNAVGIVQQERIGILVLRVGQQGLFLLLPVVVRKLRVGIVIAASVADRNALQHIAKDVCGQSHGVADSWIGELADH